MTDELTKQIELEQRLVNYQGEDRVEPGDKVLADYKANKPKTEPFTSGLPSLDKLIDGFYQGQLVIISGITGHGKTSLAQTITVELTRQSAAPLWFSYEVSCDDFFDAFPSDMPRYIYMPLKHEYNTLQWLEERIIEAKLKYNSKTVFIDHLHYLVSMNPKQNMSFMVGETVRGLKQLALKHNIVMFLIAHMQKTKADEEPGLGHIRDSSFVEQEADTVMYVWRPQAERSTTVLKLAKNRKRGVIDEKIFLTMIARQYREIENREEI